MHDGLLYYINYFPNIKRSAKVVIWTSWFPHQPRVVVLYSSFLLLFEPENNHCLELFLLFLDTRIEKTRIQKISGKEWSHWCINKRYVTCLYTTHSWHSFRWDQIMSFIHTMNLELILFSPTISLSPSLSFIFTHFFSTFSLIFFSSFGWIVWGARAPTKCRGLY